MHYKILNSSGLGVSGRQNELIELALTYQYSGVEIDMNDLLGRHDTLGKEFACQFLQSANIDLGTFDVPFDFGATDKEYQAQLAKLDTIIDLAQTLGTHQCCIKVSPQGKEFSFQENFEKHRSRISDLADRLKDADMRVGLFLQASKIGKVTGDYKFIQTAEELITLARTIGHSNVGICLDAFEWLVGDGALDQIGDLDVNQMLTEVRFADLAADADKKELKKDDRLLPGDGEDSFSVKLANLLREKDYQGPISVATDVSTFIDGSRHKIVEKLAFRLSQLCIGEDPTIDPHASEGEVEDGEAADTEGGENAKAETAEEVKA